ncbi:hypothetical protein D3C79_849860 [compost metagenome]
MGFQQADQLSHDLALYHQSPTMPLRICRAEYQMQRFQRRRQLIFGSISQRFRLGSFARYRPDFTTAQHFHRDYHDCGLD